MTRRDALIAANAGLALAVAPGEASAAATGRLKQSVARWCFPKMSVDDLCRAAADLGMKGLDLVNPPDWPTSMTQGTPWFVVTARNVHNGKPPSLAVAASWDGTVYTEGDAD